MIQACFTIFSSLYSGFFFFFSIKIEIVITCVLRTTSGSSVEEGEHAGACCAYVSYITHVLKSGGVTSRIKVLCTP